MTPYKTSKASDKNKPAENPTAGTLTGDELKKAFESFEIASQKLSEYYKNLEEEIKDLKENLNAVLESLPLGIIITDEKNIIKFINKSLTELAGGYNLVNYLNRHIDEFLKFFFNGSTAEGFIKPIFYPIETIMKTAAEKFIPVFLYVKNIHNNNNNKKNSERIFIIQNIEEIKKFKRLAELGEMSAKIAHEIRNPLGSIDLFASILQKELKDKEHSEIISDIISAVKNMNTTINNVLEFSKTVNPAVSKYSLSDVLNKSILYSSYIIKEKNITIIKEIDEKTAVEIDENLIGQTFINILVNAAQAVQINSGIIRIKSSVALKDNGGNGSGYLCIDFEDNGPGFSEDTVKNIFNPFFSTKKSGGTGLGLSIALNNVMVHGGYISAENSEKLGGAKISVFLPYLA
ncbi:MAG: sensor histidine kinase [bacterium]